MISFLLHPPVLGNEVVIGLLKVLSGKQRHLLQNFQLSDVMLRVERVLVRQWTDPRFSQCGYNWLRVPISSRGLHIYL